MNEINEPKGNPDVKSCLRIVSRPYVLGPTKSEDLISDLFVKHGLECQFEPLCCKKLANNVSQPQLRYRYAVVAVEDEEANLLVVEDIIARDGALMASPQEFLRFLYHFHDVTAKLDRPLVITQIWDDEECGLKYFPMYNSKRNIIEKVFGEKSVQAYYFIIKENGF